MNGYEIAIIGMSCRFPGARNPQEFWKNLCAGIESLTCVTAEDLRRGGLDPQLLEVGPSRTAWRAASLPMRDER